MTLIRLTSIHDIALRPVAIQQHFFVPCHIYKILRSLIHTDERCYGLIGVNACSFTSRSFLIYILFFTKKNTNESKKTRLRRILPRSSCDSCKQRHGLIDQIFYYDAFQGLNSQLVSFLPNSRISTFDRYNYLHASLPLLFFNFNP